MARAWGVRCAWRPAAKRAGARSPSPPLPGPSQCTARRVTRTQETSLRSEAGIRPDFLASYRTVLYCSRTSVASLRQLSDIVGSVSDTNRNRCPLSSEYAVVTGLFSYISKNPLPKRILYRHNFSGFGGFVRFPALAPVMIEVILYTCPTCEESCSVAPDLVCLTSFAPPAGKSSRRPHRTPARNSSCQPTFSSSSPEKLNSSKNGCKS